MTKRVVIGVLGIRNFNDQELIKARIAKYLTKLKNEDAAPKVFITTEEKGVCSIVRDCIAEQEIPCKVYQADWDTNGKSAGYVRNDAIINDAQRVIVFWDGKCPFLEDAINKVLTARKLIQVIRIDASESSYYALKERPRTEKVLQR